MVGSNKHDQMNANFISFHDLSPEGRYQYVSPSVTTLLGYQPSEVVGRPAYDFFRDDEIPACRALHAQTIAQEKVAVVVHCHMRHKDGHFIKMSIVSNLTSGGIVASTCRAAEENILRAREITGQELHFIEGNGVVVSKSWTKATSHAANEPPPRKRLGSTLSTFTNPATSADVSNSSIPTPDSKDIGQLDSTANDKPSKPPSPDSWDAAVAAISDKRTCLLIDRFTADLKVVFATPTVTDIFGHCSPAAAAIVSDGGPVPPDWIVGCNLLDFVDPGARNRVRDEITKAKAMDGICHLRFRTTVADAASGSVSNNGLVDMVLMCTADALIAIARQGLGIPTQPLSASSVRPDAPHLDQSHDADEDFVRSWNRQSAMPSSASHTPTSASPMSPPTQLAVVPPPVPVYTPGQGLVILKQNEPKYLDFAPPLALFPALGADDQDDQDGASEGDGEYDDDVDEVMTDVTADDVRSFVSPAPSAISDSSSALYAPSSVWAQQSSASTESEDVDVYARGVNGVIDDNSKLASSPQVQHPRAGNPDSHAQQQPQHHQQSAPGYVHAPQALALPSQPHAKFAQHHQHDFSASAGFWPIVHGSISQYRPPLSHNAANAHATPRPSTKMQLPVSSRPHPYRLQHPYLRPRTNPAFYAFSTEAVTLDQCVELNFFHHQPHPQAYGYPPSSQHHYAHPQHQQHHSSDSHRPLYVDPVHGSWVVPVANPQARVFRYRDVGAFDAAYGLGSSESRDAK